ncbi:hypothetical protein ACROYT_G008712 [Oculina patagonica]
MLSTGFVKVCFVVAVVEVLMGWNSVYSSSIYVGRHEAGTYSEQTPSESVLSEVSCEDANHRLCNKIIKYYGAGVCNTHDESLLNAVQSVCQATCGFCNTQDCEDEFEDLCTEYGGTEQFGCHQRIVTKDFKRKRKSIHIFLWEETSKCFVNSC